MSSIIDIYVKNRELLLRYNTYSFCILHLSRFVQHHDAMDFFYFTEKMMDGWKMTGNLSSIIRYDNLDEFILGFIFFLEEKDEDLQKCRWDAEDRRYLQQVVHFLSNYLRDDTVASHLSDSRRQNSSTRR